MVDSWSSVYVYTQIYNKEKPYVAWHVSIIPIPVLGDRITSLYQPEQLRKTVSKYKWLRVQLNCRGVACHLCDFGFNTLFQGKIKIFQYAFPSLMLVSRVNSIHSATKTILDIEWDSLLNKYIPQEQWNLTNASASTSNTNFRKKWYAKYSNYTTYVIKFSCATAP